VHATKTMSGDSFPMNYSRDYYNTHVCDFAKNNIKTIETMTTAVPHIL